MSALRNAGGRVVTSADGLDESVWDGIEVRGRPCAVLGNGEVVA